MPESNGRTTEIVDQFNIRFGVRPAGVWAAPGRVNLIGEHTDYNQGFVLPFAIDRRAAVALRTRDDGVVRVASTLSDEIVELATSAVRPGSLRGWSAYPLGVAWALARETGAALTGFDLLIDSDIPSGAGLSSSAAIECATAAALNQLWRTNLNRKELARIGQITENAVVGAPTGILDQAASMLGQRDAAVYIDCRSMETRTVRLGLSAQQLEVLVIDTKVSHEHATGGYAARRESCELAARELQVDSLRDLGVADLPRIRASLDDETFRRVRHIVTESARVLKVVALLERERPHAIGTSLNASHASMRDDFEISVPELDLAVAVSQANGAVGARMTGGGFGGSAIALVPRSARGAIEDAVADAFAQHGCRQPELFVVTPSDGATMDGNVIN